MTRRLTDLEGEAERRKGWESTFLILVSDRFEYLVSDFCFIKQTSCRIGDNGQEGFLVCSYVLRSQPCVAVFVVFDTVEFNVNVNIKRLNHGSFETTLYDGTSAVNLADLAIKEAGDYLFEGIPFPRCKPSMTTKEYANCRNECRKIFELHFEDVISHMAIALRKFGMKYLQGDTSEFDLDVIFAKKRAAEEMRQWRQDNL